MRVCAICESSPTSNVNAEAYGFCELLSDVHNSDTVKVRELRNFEHEGTLQHLEQRALAGHELEELQRQRERR